VEQPAKSRTDLVTACNQKTPGYKPVAAEQTEDFGSIVLVIAAGATPAAVEIVT
jgi:hypothetical protein